jgi:hypothetical protein
MEPDGTDAEQSRLLVRPDSIQLVAEANTVTVAEPDRDSTANTLPDPASPRQAVPRLELPIVTDWREQRDRAVEVHAAALKSTQEAEAAQARRLIAEFLREAQATGAPAPRPLSCLSYNGRTRFRTPLLGWYLDSKRTIAVDTAGEYYVLLVPHSFRARFTGVAPEPSRPPLIVGEGGRDGESMPLRDLLQRRLRTAMPR